MWVLDKTDLCLLTLASDHKIHLLRRFATRLLEDEKLHYKSGGLPMFPVTVGPLKVRIICDKNNTGNNAISQAHQKFQKRPTIFLANNRFGRHECPNISG